MGRRSTSAKLGTIVWRRQTLNPRRRLSPYVRGKGGVTKIAVRFRRAAQKTIDIR